MTPEPATLDFVAKLPGRLFSDDLYSVDERVDSVIAMRTLPLDERRVLYWRRVWGLSEGETAELLGFSRRRVRALQAAALELLGGVLDA